MTLKGHPTIGYGRALDTQGISRSEANLLRENNMSQALDDALGNFPWFEKIGLVRQGVVLEMIFNLGLDGMQGFVKMIAALARADYATAAKEMRDSRWAGQVGDRDELLARRMETGVRA